MATKPNLDNYEYVHQAPITVQPTVPDTDTLTYGRIEGVLPPSLTWSDTVNQRFSPVVQATRMTPPPAAANVSANASAASQATPIAAAAASAAISSKVGSLTMPISTFAVTGDSPITKNGQPITVAFQSQASNEFLAGSASGNAAGIDGISVGAGGGVVFTTPGLTPNFAPDLAIFYPANTYEQTPSGYTPGSQWTQAIASPIDTNNGVFYYQSVGLSSITGSTTAPGSPDANSTWTSALVLIRANTGSSPTVVGTPISGSSTISSGGWIGGSTGALTAGNGLLVFTSSLENDLGQLENISISDTLSNSYVFLDSIAQPSALIGGILYHGCALYVFWCNNVKSGTGTISFSGSSLANGSGTITTSIQITNFSLATGDPPNWRTIVNTDLTGAVFGASGTAHSVGAVPDPGSSAGTTHFLREDATWKTAVTSAGLAVPSWLSVSGSPITTSGTITVASATGLTNNQVLGTSGGTISLQSLTTGFLPTSGTWAFGGTISGNTIFSGNPKFSGELLDGTGSAGTSGQVLESTGTGVAWTTGGGGGGVPSVNSMTGAISIVAGSNVTVTSGPVGSPPVDTITIAASGGSGGSVGCAVKTTNYTATTGDAGNLIVMNTSATGSWTLSTNYANSSVYTACAYTSNVTAGSLLIVLVSYVSGSGTIPPASTSVTDTRGNTYSTAGSCGTSSSGCSLYYAINVSSGANTVKVTGLSASFPGMVVAEFKGNASSSVEDGTAGTASGQTGTTMNAASVTTTLPDDLVIGAWAPSAAATASAGWTSNSTLLPFGGIAYAVEATTGTYHPSATQSSGGGSGYSMIAAAFKIALGASLTLTLPSSLPSSSWSIQASCIGLGNLTINPNGNNIDTVSSNITGITGNPPTGMYIGSDGSTGYYTNRGGA